MKNCALLSSHLCRKPFYEHVGSETQNSKGGRGGGLIDLITNDACEVDEIKGVTHIGCQYDPLVIVNAHKLLKKEPEMIIKVFS